MRPVFISYFREDVVKVKRICRALEQIGIEYWLDEDRLEAGQNWSREIESRICSASAFILCASTQYHAKPHSFVHRELEVAVSMLSKMHPSELWYFPCLLDQVEIPNLRIDDGRYLSDYQTTIAVANVDEGAKQLAVRLEKFLSEPSRNKATFIFINQANSSGYVQVDGVEVTRHRLMPGSKEQIVVAAGEHDVEFIDHDPIDDPDSPHDFKQFESNVLHVSVAPKDVAVFTIRKPRKSGMLWWAERESNDTWVLEVALHTNA